MSRSGKGESYTFSTAGISDNPSAKEFGKIFVCCILEQLFVWYLNIAYLCRENNKAPKK